MEDFDHGFHGGEKGREMGAEKYGFDPEERQAGRTISAIAVQSRKKNGGRAWQNADSLVRSSYRTPHAIEKFDGPLPVKAAESEQHKSCPRGGLHRWTRILHEETEQTERQKVAGRKLCAGCGNFRG